MNFCSLIFVLFLPLFFLLYWSPLRRNLLSQNALLVAGSFLFYGWWDWRFLLLLSATILLTYLCALKRQRRWIIFSICCNIAILGFFKYFNFFGENLQLLLRAFGWEMDWFTIEVLLPVGISFYTFQAVGYSVDVMRGEIEPERNLLTFSAFLSFFPQLVAGPVERAHALMPQISSPRRWDYQQAVLGMRQMLWGAVKKIVVADACAPYVDKIYANPDASQGLLFVGALLFTVQIYCDFSGYCDIARGCARLFGIELMQNFRFPLFCRSLTELWRRWNISIMQWFRDYIYIPLGGSRRGKWRQTLNVVIVFLLSGLWHGAAWPFVFWGLYWAILMGLNVWVPERYRNNSYGQPFVVGSYALGMGMFRSVGVEQALCVFNNVAGPVCLMVLVWMVVLAVGRRIRVPWFAILWIGIAVAVVVIPIVGRGELLFKWYLPVAIAAMFSVEWQARAGDFALQTMPSRRWVRWCIYWGLGLLLLVNQYEDVPFIYFQF